MRTLVTGGAGFIGSNLVDRLLALGHAVTVFDDFSTGHERFLPPAVASEASGAISGDCRVVRGDLLEAPALAEAMRACDLVFHLAANADVRGGLEHPRKDIEQNTLATFNVLEAMRVSGPRKIVFASTGSIYGEAGIHPTPEDAPFPVQTSLYGSSKLAGEALVEAYCEGYGFQGWIFRLVSVLGERYTHGHVRDFHQQLIEHPDRLDVLGDGTQRKSYLYVQDCIDAMLLALDKAREKVNIFNLGTDEYIDVAESIACLTAELGLKPAVHFSGGPRGWVGDNPFIYLDCTRMRGLGWRPRLTIRDALRRTIRYLRENPWVLEQRR
jgi:UDP-glucose 4-epimerase